jgi:acetyl-CoA decarbonylase/synthase complex subunit delta
MPETLDIIGVKFKRKRDVLEVQKPACALEIVFSIKENFPDILKKYWGENVVANPVIWFKEAQKKAQDIGAEFLSVYFNIEDMDEIKSAQTALSEIMKIAKMPLIIRGSGQKNLDEELLCALAPSITKKSIIACAQDTNYKKIVEKTMGHFLVLRTPIDINLTKELSILSMEEGLKSENILIDPDMGCVGYGLDYGYSIIERIKIAADEGDSVLDAPIIVFAGEESFKAKEAKSADFGTSWGDLKTRSICWEITTATSLVCAGADIVVLWHPDSVTTIKEAF